MPRTSWTIETLKEYFEALIRDRDERYRERFDAQERAITKSELASDRRFDGVNEFRESLSDQQRQFLPRPEYERAHVDVVERVNQLSSRMDKLEGVKTGGGNVWGWVAGAIGVIVAIFEAWRKG